MLPKRLSNGICSLNPNEERLAMSCEMEIDEQGKIVNHRIFQSVMKSHARMTYKAVNKILESHDAKTMKQYEDLVPMFETMGEIHKLLLKNRKNVVLLTLKRLKQRLLWMKRGTQLIFNYGIEDFLNG